MKKITVFLMVCVFLFSTSLVFAEGLYVKGYYRSDGTYVRPHVRYLPNQFKYDNNEPSKNTYESTNPSARDNDGDGIANMYDHGGRLDDNNSSQD